MEEFKGDKRTKEYKDWKAKFDEKNKGLGDKIETITEKTGIKAVVKFIAGEDCGCDERKEKLNNLFNKKRPKCFTEDEYHFLAVFFGKSIERNVPIQEWQEFVNIYNRVFDEYKKACQECGQSNYNHIYTPLKKVFDTYK